jgi:hypothetical protein
MGIFPIGLASVERTKKKLNLVTSSYVFGGVS